MRVLVTGGAGFIGSHIVHGAVQAGFDVTVLDNFSSGKRENVPDGVNVVSCDLRDRDGLLRALTELQPDLVSHQAAQVSVAVSVREPRLDAEINIIGGLNLLDACTARGSKVSHLVFAATGGAIYGEVPEGQAAGEDWPPEPKSPYGISKHTFERLLRVYREERGLHSTVLRYANVYGPRQDPHGEAGVVAIFFDAALAGKKLGIFAQKSEGDPGCVRDYVFVGDVARANLLALQGKLEHPAINVGTGEPTTTLDLAQRILRITGSSSPIEKYGPRPGDLGRSVLDPGRGQSSLGPSTNLDAGLAQTADWYRAR